MPEDRKRQLHGEFADVLRQRHEANEDEVLEELAYHYRNSDRLDLALDLSLRAGERLKRIYANEKAYEYFNYAAELLSEREAGDETWITTQECMGELCLTLGRYDEASRIYELLLSPQLDPHVSRTAKARFFRQRGKVFEILGDYDHALRSCKDGRDLLFEDQSDDEELQLEKIWAINALGGLYVRMGKYDKAMKISIEALKIIESTSETIEHAVVFTTIGSARC